MFGPETKPGPPGNHRWLRWLTGPGYLVTSRKFLDVSKGDFWKTIQTQVYTPLKCNMDTKIAMIKRSYLLQSLIFGIHFKFIGCIQSCSPWTVTYRHTKTHLGYTIVNSKLCHKISANENSLQQHFTRQNLELATISQNMHLIGNIDTRLPR